MHSFSAPARDGRLSAVFDHTLQLAFTDHGSRANLGPLQVSATQPSVDCVLAKASKVLRSILHGIQPIRLLPCLFHAFPSNENVSYPSLRKSIAANVVGNDRAQVLSYTIVSNVE